jgi:hypothetical protein
MLTGRQRRGWGIIQACWTNEIRSALQYCSRSFCVHSAHLSLLACKVLFSRQEVQRIRCQKNPRLILLKKLHIVPQHLLWCHEDGGRRMVTWGERAESTTVCVMADCAMRWSKASARVSSCQKTHTLFLHSHRRSCSQIPPPRPPRPPPFTSFASRL